MSLLQPPITPEQIAALPPEFQALLQAVIDHYEKRIAVLEAELTAVKQELAGVKKTPRNSSLPPSTEHPHAKPPRDPDKKRSGKKRGGQPGHPKHERALIPTEQCQTVVQCVPGACRRCGQSLAGKDPEPLRHQVWDLPEIKPLITEYQLHRLDCPCCHESTCGQLPPGVPTSQGGPRLVALVALLMGCFRQSKRRVALFLDSVLNQPCSPSWVVKLQQQATAALTPAYEELAQQLPTEDVLAIDESPTKERNAKAWLWTFVATTYTVFALRTTRAATVLQELLTDAFDGVIHCDRAKMYWQKGKLQWCWAHLKRDFQALIDNPDGQAKRLGHDLMRCTRELFRQWSRCRDGTITRAEMQKLMRPVRQQTEGYLLRGMFSGNPAIQGMCRELYNHREWLWTFLEVDGVEPTNNASERALRHAVIWRKLSFGTQSAHGSRFVATILTVVETCRQQSRGTFDYLTAAMQAHFAHEPAPSLLPEA
jgi:transposase